MSVAALVPDLVAARRFLDLMAEGEAVTFQTFDDRKEGKRPALSRVLHGCLDDHEKTLAALNARGAGIYWMVNYGDAKGRREENVTGVRAVFVDLDGAPLAPVLAAGAEPHAVVESSPGKWHVYWAVTGCTLPQFEPVQRAVAQRFGGDESVHDLPRVLRLPGFYHRKHDPVMARIELLAPLQPYELGELTVRLGLALDNANKRVNGTATERNHVAVADVIQGKVQEGGRHAYLVKWAAQLNWRGMPAEAVRVAVQVENRRVCAPPKTETEVGAIVADVMKRYGAEHGRDAPARDDAVILIRATDIQPVPIAWLWPGWLALGKLHLIAGAPGQGKTTLALAMAATVTNGGRWPDGSRCEPGNVLIWSGEDDPADTLLPRLIGMGADRTRVYFIAARVAGEVVPFDPARDMVQLTAAAERIGDVRLLIVDPVVSAVTGDSHKNTEVRRALQPLVDLAAHLRAAAVGITHLSKGTIGRDPTERVTGSIAFTAVVRVVLLAARVKDDDGKDKRILVRSKSNIGPDDGGFEYHIEQTEPLPGIGASIVTWGAAIEGTARELLADAEAEASEGQSAKDSAEEFLRELLVCSTPTKTVKAEAKEAGHAWMTVRRAADTLMVIRRKGGMGEGWYWSLPEGAHKTPKVLTQKDEHLRDSLSTFGEPARQPDDPTEGQPS